MKKHLFIAFAAAGLLASCSSNDDDFNAPGGNQSGINENEPVEILLGVGTKANVTTKGTGSVGADHNELNALNLWNHELVNVYMFDQGTFDLASGDEGVIFDNALFRTPTNTASGQARHMDKGDVDADTWDYDTDGYKRNYYPMNGNFDFWAYRVDDANQKPQTTNGDTIYAYTTTPKKGYAVLTKDGSADSSAVFTSAATDAEINVETNCKAKADFVGDDSTTYTKIVFVKETFTPAAMTALVPEVTDDKVTVPFSIDGSQDILAASTVLSDDEKAKLCGSTNFATLKVDAANYNGSTDVTFDPEHLVSESAAAKAWANYRQSVYSAKVARKGIQPNLSFKHMLTRLTFDAKAMIDEFAKGEDSEVRIKSIRVKSMTEGKLVATYDSLPVDTPETAPIVTALETTSNDYSWLELKARTHVDSDAPAYTDHNKPLVSLVEADSAVVPTRITDTDYYTAGIPIAAPDGTATEIGEALLVIPEADGIYELEIEIEQTIAGRELENGNAISKYKQIKTGTIKNLKIYVPGYTETPATPFEAGKSYKVSLQVYGMTEIKVFTTLEKWADGGEIDINPDDQI